jgi:uncharacterized protein YgiM (DUF1202 family)
MSVETLKKGRINMSFKDYRNFAKKNEVKEPETVETTEQNVDVQNTEVNTDVITEDVVIQNEIQNEEVNEEPVKLFKKGVVKAAKLNIRKEANKNADVLTIVSKGTGVEINLTDSTEEFYCVKVIVNSELAVGYAMKEFIDVK